MQNFPGYDEALARKQKKEAAHKNWVSPFLLMRAGVLDKPICIALITLPLDYFVFNRYIENSIVVGILDLVCWVAPLASLTIEGYCIDDVKGNVTQNLKAYCNPKEVAQLKPISEYNRKRAAYVWTKYSAKNNPEIFKKMIEHPDTVKDIRNAEAISLGHLQSHPEDAITILKDFKNIEFVSKRVYRRAKRLTSR
ncbi:MAG: hypothetical protein J6Y07_00790 [Alphaproteobacteria bacterium]|nr:hypothetical protein [Alphaproteobacteria bacterium]